MNNIYVCSDIHGQYQLYKNMLENINFSDSDTLYILGDMIDRGPESDKLMLDIINRPNIICCVGNHEVMMYSHEIGDYKNDFWCNSSNGGMETLTQFEKLTEEELEKIKNYIFNRTYLQIELEVNNKKYLLSHSGFVEGQGTIKDWKELYKRNSSFWYSDVFDVVWRSPWRFGEYRSKESYNDGRIHIIGHVPVQAVRYDDDYQKAIWERGRDLEVEEIEELCDKLEVWQNDNIVNIDGGCAYKSKKNPPFTNIGLLYVNLNNMKSYSC